MVSKYSERLKIYKSKNEDLNPPYTFSGSGCFFHNIEELKQFSDVDDDKDDSIKNYTYI